jgi:chitodextrinase
MARVDATHVVPGWGADAARRGGAELSGSAGRNPTAAATINKRIAVLMINFARQASQPWKKDFVRDIYFGATDSVASYYAELSDGKVSITGDVFGYLTLTVSRDWCDYKRWAAVARSAATSNGVDLSAYTNVVYAFPWQSVCWWSGFAKGGSPDLPGRDSWINGLMSLYIASHELGHNLGANHAGAITCTRDGLRVAYSTTCSTYAYGDPFDIMGYTGQRHMQTWYRWRLGFLADTDVETVTTDGTYRISTAELADGSPRVLRIRRPAGDYYYLELRQPFGAYDDYATNDPAVTGISIRIARELGSQPTKLVDTTPETCTFLDAPLGVGRTFADGVNNISIKTLSVSPTGADVQIRTEGVQAQPPDDASPDDDSSPPGAPGKVSADLVTAREVAVSWESATDDAGVDHYVVTAQGDEVGTTCDLILREIIVEDARTYEFGVYAVDAAGNVGPTRTVSFAVADVTPPSAPRRFSATAVGARSISLNWRRASDNAAVTGYLLTRDGALVAELTATTTSYTDVSLTPRRTYRYKLTAIDAARNASPPAKVRVRL